MALKKEDLLKFSKRVEFGVKLIEDDSSGGENGTEVKILHLANTITAEGSIPTPEGGVMKVTGNKIYVAADNIDKMLEGMEEKDGVLVYTGDMHLDVSKPKGRMQNGTMVITTPAKIWLTKTKFSRSGGNLATQQRASLGDVINKLFSGGKTLDLTAETASTNVPAGQAATEPEVVVNQEKPDAKNAGKQTAKTGS